MNLAQFIATFDGTGLSDQHVKAFWDALAAGKLIPRIYTAPFDIGTGSPYGSPGTEGRNILGLCKSAFASKLAKVVIQVNTDGSEMCMPVGTKLQVVYVSGRTFVPLADEYTTGGMEGAGGFEIPILDVEIPADAQVGCFVTAVGSDRTWGAFQVHVQGVL